MPTPPPSPLDPVPERPSSSSVASTSSAASPSTPRGPPTRATRGRPWPSPRWPTSSSPGSCATTRPTRDWPDRDRFVLSNGHASILLYSMLHLTGYGLTLDDLRAFRHWGSATPGHPERHHTAGRRGHHRPARPGLRQRRRHGDRRALAARPLLPRAVRPPHLRGGRRRLPRGGHLPRGRLAGRPPRPRSPGLRLRRQPHHHRRPHRARAWTTTPPSGSPPTGGPSTTSARSANDLDALEAALLRARADEDRPSLIILRSHIGYPAPDLTDSAKAHGDPFSDEETRLTKELLGLPVDETFWVPDDVLAMYRSTIPRGRAMRAEWEARLDGLGRRPGPVGRRPGRPRPARVGGDAADLRPGRRPDGHPQGHQGLPRRHPRPAARPHPRQRRPDRQHRDGAGRGHRPVGRRPRRQPRPLRHPRARHGRGHDRHGRATAGPSRSAAPSSSSPTTCAARSGWRPSPQAHVVYSWTHDSVGLGQDGPTHQPIEQLAAVRAMPGLRVIRPADANETAQAWRIAVDGDGPTALDPDPPGPPGPGRDGRPGRRRACPGAPTCSPTRATVRPRSSSSAPAARCRCASTPPACWPRPAPGPGWSPSRPGSSSPSRTTPTGTRSCPPGVPVLSVEAASTFGWERYADDSLGIDHFGASAPGDVVLREFGFDPVHVAARATALLGRRLTGPHRPGPIAAHAPPDPERTTDDHPPRPLRPPGPEPVARQPPARLAPGRHAGRPRRPGHPRGDLQPDHLRQGHQRPGHLRRAVRLAHRHHLGRGRLLGPGGRRHPGRAGHPPARLRRLGRGRRLRVGRGGAVPGPRHRGHHRRRPRTCTSGSTGPTCWSRSRPPPSACRRSAR